MHIHLRIHVLFNIAFQDNGMADFMSNLPGPSHASTSAQPKHIATATTHNARPKKFTISPTTEDASKPGGGGGRTSSLHGDASSISLEFSKTWFNFAAPPPSKKRKVQFTRCVKLVMSSQFKSFSYYRIT